MFRDPYVSRKGALKQGLRRRVYLGGEYKGRCFRRHLSSAQAQDARSPAAKLSGHLECLPLKLRQASTSFAADLRGLMRSSGVFNILIDSRYCRERIQVTHLMRGSRFVCPCSPGIWISIKLVSS